ncbi:MAG: putative solute-binding protein [Gammaproteobacteria bacterium]
MTKFWRLFLGLVVVSLSVMASPARAQTACVFDIMGAQGDIYALARDYALQVRRMGINLRLRPYTDERVALEDFKAGQCDAVLMTNLRGRQLNKFVGTLDSLGSVPTYEMLRSVIGLLMSPKSAPRMVNGPYEVASIIPLGAVYPVVNDRNINTLAKASGKRIAAFDWDQTQAILIKQIGARPVSADITNFAGKFNNGQVDIISVPALAVRPLELHKGIGTKGAIINMPFMNITGIMVIRHDRFNPGDGQRLRDFSASLLDPAFALIKRSEAEIPPHFWSEVPRYEVEGYMAMMRESRVRLAKEGHYDPDMLRFLKRVRCRINPGEAECSMDDE